MQHGSTEFTEVFLTKRDQARNQDRIYGIVVGSSLYGEHSVMRFSGRRGQYTRIWPPIVCADEAEAERQADRLLRRKLARGYSEN